jgi:hypothetical protein
MGVAPHCLWFDEDEPCPEFSPAGKVQCCTSPKRQLLANDPAVPKERIQGRNYTSLMRRFAF